MNEEDYPDQFKIHETQEDRVRQKEILSQFAHGFNLTGKLTTTLDRTDAKLFKGGKYCAVAEAKYRNNPINKYRDYTVDVEKVDELIGRAATEGVRAFLVVSWEGDVRYINLSKLAASQNTDDGECLFPISVQQRRDRKELADKVYHIPTDLFKKVAVNE